MKIPETSLITMKNDIMNPVLYVYLINWSVDVGPQSIKQYFVT